MGIIRLIDFNLKTDFRGELVVVEGDNTIPFAVKRIYYMYGMQAKTSRGYHAHKNLEQIVFPIAGQCRMVLDDGCNNESFILNNRKQGLYIGKMIWHEMHDFSEECILVALASDYYDENDYIREYPEFLKLINK